MRIEEFLHAFEQVREDHGLDEILFRIGFELLRGGNYGAARKALEASLAENWHHKTLEYLGHCTEQLGESNTAALYFAAAACTNRQANAFLGLARVHLAQKRLHFAFRAATMARRDHPDSPGVQAMLRSIREATEKTLQELAGHPPEQVQKSILSMEMLIRNIDSLLGEPVAP